MIITHCIRYIYIVETFYINCIINLKAFLWDDFPFIFDGYDESFE